MTRPIGQVALAMVVLILAGGMAMRPLEALSQDRAAPAGDRPTFAKDGTVHVPAFDLPPSTFASKESADALKARAAAPAFQMPNDLDIKTMRMGMEAVLNPYVKLIETTYPADIEQRSIGGVPTRVVTPRGVRSPAIAFSSTCMAVAFRCVRMPAPFLSRCPSRRSAALKS